MISLVSSRFMGSEVHVHCAHWNQWVGCLLEQEKNTYVEQLLPTVKVIHNYGIK